MDDLMMVKQQVDIGDPLWIDASDIVPIDQMDGCNQNLMVSKLHFRLRAGDQHPMLGGDIHGLIGNTSIQSAGADLYWVELRSDGKLLCT